VSEVITLMLGLAFIDADGISVYPLSTLQVRVMCGVVWCGVVVTMRPWIDRPTLHTAS
jgi:hypothetical protein